ncbi:MAG: HyaD/HybD family hydrogenase maturation endopeptidase [Spirochaetota bacterium]|nr:HyaD/HybD family hydrogenase maturation endopeptidase [Spirochaetota bacterium]
MQSTLIIGIGNILQSDEGIGVHIVNHILESGIKLPEEVEVIDGGTSGFDLLPYMKGRDKIIIIDALRTDDVPGSIYRFSPDYALESHTSLSLHEVGIMQVIKMLYFMGENPKIEIIGIVPEDINTLNINISPAVRESIPKAVELILNAAAN